MELKLERLNPLEVEFKGSELPSQGTKLFKETTPFLSLRTLKNLQLFGLQ